MLHIYILTPWHGKKHIDTLTPLISSFDFWLNSWDTVLEHRTFCSFRSTRGQLHVRQEQGHQGWQDLSVAWIQWRPENWWKIAWEKTSFAEKSCVAQLYPDKDTKSHFSLKKICGVEVTEESTLKGPTHSTQLSWFCCSQMFGSWETHPQLLVSGILEYQGYLRRFHNHHSSKPQTYPICWLIGKK